MVAASNCAAHTAELIARSFEGERLPPNVDGVVAFPHGDGCGQPSAGLDQLRRTLGGVLMHPNVSAAVILGLGCEVNQIDHYLGAGSRAYAAGRHDAAGQRRHAGDGGGDAPRDRALPGAGRGGRARAGSGVQDRAGAELRRLRFLLRHHRESGAGRVLGPAGRDRRDRVLAETTEIFGAEHLLVRRARNREVAEKLLGCIRKYKDYLTRFHGSFDDNPSPGNKEGGLTNILEKSLGAVAKGGTATLIDVFDYAERITAPGFVFMNTPGYDPVSLTGLAAGGCNLIAFTTGRGSAIGFPTIPVIKIATNSNTYRRMPDNMDINAGRIADGDAGVQRRGAGDLRPGAGGLGAAHLRRTARTQGIRAVAHRPGDVAWR